MLKNKKNVIISLIIIIICILVLTIAIFIINKKNYKEPEANNPTMEVTIEELKNNFSKLFDNVEHAEEENPVYLAYDIVEEKQRLYDIDAKVPLFNLESEDAKKINNEINNIFARKLLNIVATSEQYTIYNIEYKTFKNDNIISLVIKCTLKEGTNPQRIIMQTYNYDIEKNKLVDLEEIIKLKNINKANLQQEIIETIESKNTSTEELLNQGFNVFVRDLNSEEYLIENLKTYFLGEDGHLYVVFPYGNNNFTQEIDFVII